MKKQILPVILFSIIVGCSTDFYQRDADLQVNKLLADRKESTLGYEQKTPVTTQPIAPPNPRTYAVIPVTPIPPPGPAPLEAVHYEPGYQRLGPLPPDKSAAGEAASTSGFDTADLERETIERLRLGPPPFGKQAITSLDLFGSIRYAVMYSPDYQDNADKVYLAALNVLTQRHMFEPQPFAGVTGTYAVSRIPTNAHNISDYRFGPQVGVTQNLPYGGSLKATAAMVLLDTLHDHLGDGESAQLALTGSIPLLRGAGMVNLDPLISSERDLVYAIRTFEDYRRNFAVQVATSYFNLLTQQENIVNLRLKYASSSALTEQTRELYAAGRPNFSYLQVQFALQAALGDENNLVNAEQSYANSLDSFKQLLGMPITQNLDVQGVDLNIDVPALTREKAVELALKYRLDLKTAQDKIEDARRTIEERKNALLPDLTLTGTGQLGDDAEVNTNPALSNRYFNYSAGFDLELPLDRTVERNNYRSAMIAFENARRAYNRTYDQVQVDVRASLGDLNNDQLTMEIQRRAIDLAQRRVEYAVTLLTQGQALSRDVTDPQADLLAAQDAYNQAKASLQIAILNFLKVTGTLRLNPDAGSLATAMDVTPSGESGEDPAVRKLKG